MRLAQRLAALETIWPEPDNVITEGDIGSLRYWSSPTTLSELRVWCGLRAHYRHLADVGPDWWKLTTDERTERIQYEADELFRLVALLGDDAGFAQWHAQAEDWQGPHGRCDKATLDARLQYAWANADVMRDHPSSWLFRQTWPEWSPGMTDAEHLAFDALLSQERETRLAQFQDETKE